MVVNATDAAGNPAASVTRSFTIDDTDPVLTVGAPANGSYVRGTITLTFSASDNFPPVPATATLDGDSIFSGHMLATEGSHVLIVNAVDRAGNAAPTVTRTFTIDSGAPTFGPVDATPSGTIVGGTLRLTVVADDNFAAVGSLGTDIAVTATNPAGAVTPTSVMPSTISGGRRQVVATFDTTLLTDGSLSVAFNLSDRAGNPAMPLTVTRTPVCLSFLAPCSL